jgi:hypothetical protein
MAPPDKGFDADDFVALEIEDRLVVEFELAIRQGRAHVAFERAARLHLHIHARLEEMECPARRALGPVKRQVRISHQ